MLKNRPLPGKSEPKSTENTILLDGDDTVYRQYLQDDVAAFGYRSRTEEQQSVDLVRNLANSLGRDVRQGVKTTNRLKRFAS